MSKAHPGEGRNRGTVAPKFKLRWNKIALSMKYTLKQQTAAFWTLQLDFVSASLKKPTYFKFWPQRLWALPNSLAAAPCEVIRKETGGEGVVGWHPQRTAAEESNVRAPGNVNSVRSLQWASVGFYQYYYYYHSYLFIHSYFFVKSFFIWPLSFRLQTRLSEISTSWAAEWIEDHSTWPRSSFRSKTTRKKSVSSPLVIPSRRKKNK